MSTSEPIAIIGSGCRFPGDVTTPSKLWDVLHEPQDLLTPIPRDRFNAKGFYHQAGDHHGHTNVTQAYLLSGYRRFDAQFFGINPAEAKVMDPQMRLLLETVYEALESAGQTIHDLHGSDTAVYSGAMTNDYEHSMGRDQDSIGTYHVTGTARALLSNRISYFFDWRGPSVTLDTACSSSLYAVHYAVQQLRSGASRVAVATGANLLLDPMGFISESKLKMLSPNSRSRMWDAAADGYARGEGVAAIVLKTLSAAQADGDDIECIIRETAVNQDGKTRGITVPSAEAQASMIQDCYRRAGLDISNATDRPQYFEAHGTGTPAGDPVEAEAIHSVFGGRHDNNSLVSPHTERDRHATSPLYVGSVKTVIGHTEGTAGLAGLLKASLAIQHEIIPPNLLFERLNPRIRPFYQNVSVPTSPISWPSVPHGHPRRASVNSFGFGGANAHAILESYPQHREEQLPAQLPAHSEPIVFPFIFSAASRDSLLEYLSSFATYLLDDGARVSMQDLAYTLNSRRTRFPFVAAFSAATREQLATMINSKLGSVKHDAEDDFVVRVQQAHHSPKPRILAVFTGQGAQWPRMGAELVSTSASARRVLNKLEARLARLPTQDRPSWSLTEELLKPAHSSNIGTAAVSQPLCTAIQIILVDLLRTSGVELSSVLGHSSGEIAAVYAAGLISAEDAICIAYYRGLCTEYAQGPEGQPGAMMAVETSPEDFLELVQEPEYRGRACIAAINASSSITVSGDADTIDELGVVLKDEGKFARRLKVDKAYHSHHMNPCSAIYLSSLRQTGIQVAGAPSSQCTWFSSVYEHGIINSANSLQGPYWDDNMRNPVLFKQAVERACGDAGPFDLVVEIGPHPALKRPVLQTTGPVPYTGLLKRGAGDLESLAHGVGYIAAHLAKHLFDHQAYEMFVFGTSSAKLVKELPPYSWNHEHEYWHESRYTRAVLNRSQPVHELLGHLSPDSTGHDMRWRNLLRPQEVTWLKGHQLQDQIVFPAAGYIVTALEASRTLFKESPASFIELSDVEISRALVFDSTESSVEIVFSLSDIQRQDDEVITAKFNYSASTGRERGDALDSLASGNIYISLGDFSPMALPARSPRSPNLIRLKEDDFYSSLGKLGYQYSDSFRSLSGLKRKLGRSTGLISDVEGSQLLVHPAVLDGAFQSVLLSSAAPDDGTLWSMHVPVSVRRIRVNPGLCAEEMSRGQCLSFDAFRPDGVNSISGDVDVFPTNSTHALLQVEGLECIPLSPATAKDDKILFSSTVWGPAFPDAGRFCSNNLEMQRQYAFAHQLDRVACFYLRNMEQSVASDHPSRSDGPYKSFFKFAAHTIARTRSDEWAFWKPEWENDTTETIAEACRPYAKTVDVRLLCELGQRLPDIVTGKAPAIEIAVRDGMLTEYYQKALGVDEYATFLAQTVKQIAFRFPQPRCLEIGAGTGGATRAIFRETGHAISSYTFTDISSGFFEAMQTESGIHANRMLFKVLDIGKDVCSQGFEKHSYDLIVASMVLHATPSLATTLSNIRSLIKPGGYLVVLEVQNVERAPARLGTVFGSFPGWWEGSDEGRDLSPAVSLADWDNLLRKARFSGIDTSTPDPAPFVQPMTLFVSQALDEKVEFLREPLARSTESFGPDAIIPDLVLLGGSKVETSALIAQLQDIFRQNCGTVKTARTLADLQLTSISSSTTVLSLAELDGPVFLDLTESKWNAFKSVFQEAGSVFWVTNGRRIGNAHANMTVGLLRSALNELPGLDVQFLDFELPHLLDASTLGKALLRFRAATVLKRIHPDAYSHVTTEREFVIEKDGQVVVPRLVAESSMNNRYNSSRRSISRECSAHEGHISIETVGSSYFIRQDVNVKAGLRGTERKGRITHSLLEPTKLTGRCRLFLALGKLLDSEDQFLSLSTSNSSAISPETLLTQSVDVPSGSEARFLQLVSLLSLCWEVDRGLEEGDRVLVHEPSPDLILVMRHVARARGLAVTFTTSRNDYLQDCYKIHPNAPERIFGTFAPSSLAVFVDFSSSTNIGKRIRSQLPHSCKCETRQTLFNKTREASRELDTFSGLEPQVVRLDDVSQNDSLLSPQSVVDWTRNDKVSIEVQPVDSHPIFSSSKTYWLVGLTGSLGLSLCQWMVHRGARYVAISSRHPNVDESWLNEMASFGAEIKVYSSDVTRKDDVVTLHRKICQTLPPIAGVVQGAMVLSDTHLSDMSLDTLLQNTRPKVEGSIYLNELFLKDVLDFFVFLSSASIASGTPGQSAYVAANMFMVGLAQQRRRLGLAASVINIGPIAGVGYLAHQQEHSFAAMKASMGFEYLSERDFHQMFAEAVLSGRPQSTSSVEITSGIRFVSSNEQSPPIWSSNPMMSHFLLREEAPVNGSSGIRPKAHLKSQLLSAQHRDEVGRIVQEAFLEKIGTWFQFDASNVNQSRLDATRLDEIGIDSLIAIEISSWLMKNLQFNLPVLKILSGISIGEIITAAIEGISTDLIPNVQQQAIPITVEEVKVADSESIHGSESSSPSSAGIYDSDGEAQTSVDLPEPISAVDIPESESWGPMPLTSTKLSAVQSMFWVNSTLFDNKASQNFAGLARITGPVDVNHLKKTVWALGQRHESLRTCYFLKEGIMMQGIMESSALRLDAREISDEREVMRETRRVEEHNFDLQRGDTLRLVLLSISPTRHFLILGTTHLAMDGFSFQVILRELLPRNSTELEIQEPLQYREYCQAQERDLDSGKLRDALAFWKAQYLDLPPPLPILRVSRASARPTLATFSDDKVEIRIDAEAKSRIGAICREFRATPFHFYLACYRVLLARYADAEDVAIGIEDASRRDVQTLGAVGVFLNVLPLRFKTSLSTGFADMLQETRSMMHAALENAQVPFPVLLNESGQRLKDTWSDCELEFEPLRVSTTGYDLNLDIIDDPDGGCLLSLIFRDDLYQKSEATILMKSYENLLNAFSTKPQAELTKPSLFESHDVRRALTHGHGPLRASDWPETVIHRIQDVFEACPDDIAIKGDSGKSTTYRELSKLSSSIAMAMIGAGASKGSKIAVLQEPTPLWIASILAIIGIGAVYLPLDLSLPWTRLAAIAKDCQPQLVLVDEVTTEHAHELQLYDIPLIDVSVVDLKEAKTPIAATATAPAMIFYTSGSSGVPKGVIQTHEGIRNHMELTEETYHVGSEVVLQQSACSFDLSCAQIFTALCYGGSIYILPRHLRSDSRTIADLIVQEGITYTYGTPSEYSSWLRHGKLDSLRHSSWRRVLCGGEPVTNDLLTQFRDMQKTDLRFFNCYGPTETTIVAATVELNYQYQDHPTIANGISAGFALPNYTLYIVDSDLNPVATGVQGEIYIGGAGVSPGYLHNPALNTDAFVPDPFAPSEYKAKGWTTMHRVGDVGRWKEDGSILVEGRISGDTQVKLRGLRVDLREIESNLLKVADGILSEVSVSARRSSPESPEFLVAHTVLDPARASEGHERFLRSLPGLLPLPRYMCPAMVIPVEQMPRTSTSKLDRRALAALPLPDLTAHEDGDHAELTQTEAQLREIWQESIPKQITAMHDITPSTDYFHVGGTSLLLPYLQAQILAKFGIRPPVIKLLQFSTLGGMASLVENRPRISREPTVNWEAETALSPAILRSLDKAQDVLSNSSDPSIVVLTGSTGYLGRAILDALIADDGVAMVHCIGVRNASSRHDMLSLPKTQLYDGDLKLPRLGLTEEDAGSIFAQASHIIHNGAEVSHLQSYGSLRLPNLQSTKELVEMSLPRRIPVHFVSSTQVGLYYATGTGRREFPEESVAAYPPPVDGSAGGYPATKWASERFLERLADSSPSGWPIFVHRPSTILRPPGDLGLDLLANLRRWSAQINAVPVAPNLHGYVDTVELQQVVSGVVSALHGSHAGEPGIRFHQYFGAMAISLDDPKTLLLGVERAGEGPPEELMALEWAARARAEGLDPWLEEWIEDVLRQGEQVIPKVVK
ncbi:hypothetical protein J7T55_010460 [Diaporthe amygdali]|uniref:uncharacterized protein n=1 Tax=Phomopsis amygdali TaxID=1214568 RepID=UPI0022FDC18E|nr:uncharacterized protein J7T55_010460 [Diaporthe amygdali]KAJ0115637.1 hypothetical protein J7T55_010460 [Diaporthe amygdali]